MRLPTSTFWIFELCTRSIWIRISTSCIWVLHAGYGSVRIRVPIPSIFVLNFRRRSMTIQSSTSWIFELRSRSIRVIISASWIWALHTGYGLMRIRVFTPLIFVLNFRRKSIIRMSTSWICILWCINFRSPSFRIFIFLTFLIFAQCTFFVWDNSDNSY